MDFKNVERHWQTIYVKLSREFHWTPEQISRMTMEQIFLYLEECQSDGHPTGRSMSRAGWHSYAKEVQARYTKKEA